MPVDPRTFVNARYALQVQGVTAGFLHSVEGGNPKAEVITEKQGQDFFVKKHLGQVKYEDITLQCGLSLDKSFYDWVSDSWTNNTTRKDGAIVALDVNYNSVSALEFSNALITEVTIPALDGSSKEPAYLTIKMTPEVTRTKPLTGKLKLPVGKGDNRTALTSNFRLDIPGLDCTRTARIEPITVKHTFSQSGVGEQRDYEQGTDMVEFPNLRITFGATAAQSWNDWFQDFVIQGNCGENQEKSGTLELLSPNLKSVLMRLNLSHLGIFRLAQERSNEQNPISRVVADLYCQQMSLQILPA